MYLKPFKMDRHSAKDKNTACARCAGAHRAHICGMATAGSFPAAPGAPATEQVPLKVKAPAAMAPATMESTSTDCQQCLHPKSHQAHTCSKALPKCEAEMSKRVRKAPDRPDMVDISNVSLATLAQSDDATPKVLEETSTATSEVDDSSSGGKTTSEFAVGCTKSVLGFDSYFHRSA